MTAKPRDESHAYRIARRKLSAPPEWEVCGWKRVGTDGLLIEGGVPRLLASGPNKGQKTWRDSTITEAIVTQAEMEAEFANYEASTGKCGECMGTGETWAGWKQGAGHWYRPCTVCGATGLAALRAALENKP